MQNQRNILLLGSGLMAESLAKHILTRPENHIHVASDIEEQAKKLAEKLGIDRCSHSKVDVTNPNSLGPLVQNCEIVISYVPAFLHMHVAKVCLEKEKHMITASYVTPEMKALDEEVKKKNLIFLNELGLDPGIDHLATMKIVHEVEKQGGKILQYESWCGGLPSPTDCDNPLGYKFTWSPIGAFRAFNNKAVYLENNKQIQIEARDLLYFGRHVALNQALELEGYPNRNSIPYKEMYGLKDATKVLRGTLRYKGFCTIINAMKEIGVTKEISVQGGSWLEHIENLLKDEEGNTLDDKIFSRCIGKVKQYESLTQQQRKSKFKQIMKAFKFFDILSQQSKFHDPTKNSLQNLVKLLEPKLSLRDGQTDLIAMQHLFVIEKNGKKTIRKSSMIQIGDKKGFSAMSLTVGTPTAIGTQLILDGKISERGVIVPMYPDIYNPVLEKLEEEGIKLIDTEDQI